MYKYEEAITILVDRFPNLKSIYELDKDYYENLPYIFYESEFVKFIIETVKFNNRETLIKIFEFVENMLKNGDKEFKNLIEVAVIESLYFDNNITDKKDIEIYFGDLTLKSYQECL